MEYVYIIHYPGTDFVVYVGKSNKPEKRFKQHLSSRKSLIGLWCRAIRYMGIKPIMSVIATAHNCNICTIENRFILHYKSLGQAIFNKDCTPYGGYNLNPQRNINLQVRDLLSIRNILLTA